MPGRSDAAGALPCVDVLGVPVSAITMAEALDTIDGWIRTRTPHYVCVTGVHGVMESQRDEEIRRIHRRAGLVTPDGMPLVWLAHLRGHRQVERVYGPDLMLAYCARSIRTGTRHFFFGGAPGMADRVAAGLSRRFPGLSVAGTHAPPFRPPTREEDDRMIAMINQADPDIVWVGLSTPKQERWMAEHVGRLRAAVLVGVGAAFDFHAGAKPQAPRWMQQHGLEWSFRLATEPRRLWKRYLINNPSFVWRVTMSWMRTAAMPGVRPRVERRLP
jgi:N-acetylglucosaminyldiphosphoundecaprenol N-acetyl-beta-D-mannosaminyltransferase